jgi:hypothetical protein
MAPRGNGDFQLGADTVIGGDQQRIAETGGLQVEKPAKAAESGVGAAAGRRAGKRFDGLNQGVAGIDIDARILVAQLVVAGIPACYGVLRSHEVFKAGI